MEHSFSYNATVVGQGIQTLPDLLLRDRGKRGIYIHRNTLYMKISCSLACNFRIIQVLLHHYRPVRFVVGSYLPGVHYFAHSYCTAQSGSLCMCTQNK